MVVLWWDYVEVYFIGVKIGEDLVWYYVDVDVFVFFFLIDIFGNVILEVFVCGVFVVVYLVMGLLDVIGDIGVGVLLENFGEVVEVVFDILCDYCWVVVLNYIWVVSVF